MSHVRQLATLRAPAQEELTTRAERWLRSAGVWGQIPTPIEPLYRAARIIERDMLELVTEPGFVRAIEHAEDSVRKAWQKLLGIADLRKRIVYIAKDMPSPRKRFTQLHEFSHQAIPWHDVQLRYTDRQHELSQNVRNAFEREANFMGSELLFQGGRFVRIARDYRPSADAIFHLADMHLASRHATARRFVEAQDGKVGLAIYYPGGLEAGTGSFTNWGYVSSNTLRTHIPEIEFPSEISPDHPWLQAVRMNQCASGEIGLNSKTDGSVAFEWESWWNHYSLFVLIQCSSRLARLRNAVRF